VNFLPKTFFSLYTQLWQWRIRLQICNFDILNKMAIWYYCKMKKNGGADRLRFSIELSSFNSLFQSLFINKKAQTA